MPQTRSLHQREQGVALVVTLAIVLVVGLLVLGAAVMGVIDRTVSANQLRSNAAYYVAQDGIEVYKTAVFRNLVDFYARSGSGWCETPIADGVKDGLGNVVLGPGGWTAWVPSGAGSYRARLDLSDTYLVLTSEGRVADAVATVQLVASAGGGPASAWDNAVLARGATPGSKAINGNVAIYGSVHIVRGDFEVDTPLAVGGSAGVYNTYVGKNAANTNIVAEISGIVNTNVDLCSRIKIAQGNVYLESGSVQLGTSTDPLYSIHLGDGIVCRQREQSDGSCRASNVVADHNTSTAVYLRYPESAGMNSAYGPFDLDLPLLQQSAIDRAFKTDVGGTPVAGCEWLYSGGSVVLPPVVSATPSAVCGDATNQMQWIAGSPGYLRIQGDVNVPNANVNVTGTLLYEGKGTLLVGASLTDSTARFTIGNGGSMRPRTPLTYPRTNAMAVMSTGDLAFGSTAANDPTAALLYAKGTFQASKQITIVGAVVAETFDLGNNVPKIAYHPDIRFAAEDLCLPGTACAGDGAPQNPGILADIAIERR